ncbi:unnamed protein product [Prunus brigantina]
MKLFSHLGNSRMGCKAKLMIHEDEKYEGKPFAISHARTAITTIKAKFNTQQLQRFEGSCFGHLLLIEDLQWNSQIVHGLLMRKADPKTVTQVNGIKFIVGNKLIQFTAQHFCLIMGLRFGKLHFIPKVTNENCSLKQKYFSSNKPATLLDLHTSFIECIDDDDTLKLGMVYFAIFVLLGTEKHVLIDMRYLKLAEDLEEFDKYPWGTVSYAMTNASLLRAVSPDYQRVKIWAFEVFPALEALHFTVREDNRHIPRILHWRSNTVARFWEVMSQVYENFEVDVQLLRPTDIEKQQPYWSWDDDENNEEIVQLFGDEGEDKTNTSSEEKEVDVEETATLPSSSKHQLESTKDELAKLRSSNRGLRNRVRDLEAIVDKNCLKHENECDRNKKAIWDLTLTIASVEHYFKLEMEELKKLYGGEGHEEGVGRKARPRMETSINLVGDEGDKEANATVQKPDAEGKGCRLKRPAKTLLSPFTDPSRKKRPATGFHAQTPEAHFDPTKPVAMDDVKAMIQVCKAWKSDISAELELEPFVVGTDFFYKLVDETAWMSSRPFTPPIAKRVTRKQLASRTVDPLPNYLRNIHHFVYGSWQHGYAQAWTKVRKVYLPYNVRQSHWVAVEIDFVRHTATVYDSYTVFTSNTMLVRHMEPITHTLAKVLYDMRFYEKLEVEAVKRKGIDMSTFNPFTICRISDVPQQSDGTSCGIMTVNTIDPAKFGYYRLKLAIEAFRGEAYGIGDFNTVDGNVHVLQLASDLSMAYVLNSDCVSSKTCIMLFMKGGPSRFIPILTSQILYTYSDFSSGCSTLLINSINNSSCSSCLVRTLSDFELQQLSWQPNWTRGELDWE